MKALVLEKNQILTYKEVPVPVPEADKNILVKVLASGICGSDIPRGFGNHSYHYPLIMGHEFAGIVEKAPADSCFKKGSRVVIFPLLPCYSCKACKNKDYAKCENYDYYGSRRDGGFAEYVYVPETNLISLPDDLDMSHAAMTEPCAVAHRGASKFNIIDGSSGLVIGAGPIGNMVAQWLKLKGCGTVYVSDINDEKLKLAESMGFIAINSLKQDLVEVIGELTSGEGVNHVVEACGLPSTFLQAIKCTSKNGEIVFMGNIKGTFSLDEGDFSSILRKELKIYGTWNSSIAPSDNNDWKTVLQFIGKEIDVKPLISHKPMLSEGSDIFQKFFEDSSCFNKVIFQI